MHVAFLTDGPLPYVSGVTVAVRRQRDALREAGVTVTVIGPHGDVDIAEPDIHVPGAPAGHRLPPSLPPPPRQPPPLPEQHAAPARRAAPLARTLVRPYTGAVVAAADLAIAPNEELAAELRAAGDAKGVR